MFGEGYAADEAGADRGSHVVQGRVSDKSPHRGHADKGTHATIPAPHPMTNLLHADSDEERPKTVEEIIQTLDAEQSVSGPKGGCCARVFIPFVVCVLLLGVVGSTLWTSGTGVDGAAEPRVALLIFEGLGGSSFEALLQAGQRLPNVDHLLQHHAGRRAECVVGSSSHCARATAVENATTGEVRYCSACSLASILSGVPPSVHGVRDDTLAAMAQYADGARRYPSLARRVTDAGRKVSVVGTSHLLHSFAAVSGRCAEAGVLDLECAASAEDAIARSIDPYTELVSLECLPTQSCNTHTRRIRQPTNPRTYGDDREEAYFTRQLESLFGALAFATPSQEGAVQNSVADNVQESLFIFHFDALAVRAQSAALQDFTYSVDSLPYVAQAYLLDAQLGQLFAFLQDRSRSQKENWLIVGTSDHGGVGKTYTNASAHEEIGAVPFFMATYTTSARRHVRLGPLTQPVSHLDVLPTVLRWLNVAPYDDATERVVRGENVTVESAEVEARVRARAMLEGHVQGICSSGVAPVDCVS